MFASLLFLSRKFHCIYLFALGVSFFIFSISFSSCDHQKLTSSEIEFTSGEIPQEVYVWQRVWTDEVKSAVKNRAVEFENTIHLAAEISFHKNQWRCQSFHHDSQLNPAFRIHSNAAKTRWNESALKKVSDYIKLYPTEAKSIQIDYDCPSRKLADYTKLLIQLKKEFPNRSLEITCLPDWLNYPDFAILIQHTDRYIMQVHGVSGHGKGRALCNPDQAHRTALACAELGKPFLIALPTYRHAVSYDSDGKVTDIASEGHYQKSRYEVSSADPVQLSELIQHWQKRRPTLMKGVIWYRLPVTTDRMNWTWDTFQKVRHGEAINISNLDISMRSNEDGIYQLTMSNNSNQHLNYPEKIHLNWQGFCIANHLSDQFTAEQITRSKGISILWKKSSPYPIAPGETVRIGSFRFIENIDQIEITTP